MWLLTIRSAQNVPNEYRLKPGLTALGRKPGSDIVIADISASRQHAEITFQPDTNTVYLKDLNSTNGTFVNRERLIVPRRLMPGDEIRIGNHVISVDHRDTSPRGDARPPQMGTSPLTRDFLLESLDRHAVLLSEVAERLATVLDLDTALREAASLMQRSMGADKCEVLLAERFDQLHELGFPEAIARMALENHLAVILPDVAAQGDSPLAQSAMLLRIRSALCVPVLSGDTVVGLIYVYKTSPTFRPFDQRDLQLAVAISHQAALTIQRAHLLRRVRKEQRIRELLRRFLAPSQADALMQDYLATGRLPGVQEQVVTVLFVDIQDSTSLAERLGARLFGQLLSQYYAETTAVVFAHGGLMHQYVGDGLMAVFGMFGQTEPETQAVRAAIKILERRTAITVDGQVFSLGIGVNTGPTMAGYLEIGDRIEFSVLGDTVNVTHRLESLARPNRILIGPATFAAIGNGFRTLPIGPVEVRGRTQPVEAHEVLGAA
jgi:class 3 adenylate cyclase